MSGVRWQPKGAQGPVTKSPAEQTLESAFGSSDPTDAARKYAQLEPHLHQAFFNHISLGKAFEVKASFRVYSQIIMKAASFDRRGSIQEGVRVINPGDELRCVAFDGVLKSFIFKNQRDEEFEVYFTPRLALNATQDMRNDGYYGLLLNTSVFEEALSTLGAD